MSEKIDEWWRDWRNADVASKWGGEMTTEVEDMYQAFKARLMEELVAQKPSVLIGNNCMTNEESFPLVPRSES